MKLPLLILAALPIAALAAEQDYQLTLRNNQFTPSELHVPAGKRLRLVVNNQDAAAEEFESYDLNREKVIPANSSGFVFIGPLAPGRYPFFGDFHQQSAHGAVIAE